MMDDLPSYTYLDPETGVLVSRGAGTIAEDSVQRAEDGEDQRKWDVE